MKKGVTFSLCVLNLVVRALTMEPSCPVCSKYEYEEKLLERVLRNEHALEHTLHDIKATHAKVVDALKTIHDKIGSVNTAIGTMDRKQIVMEETLDNAIKTAQTNVSESLSHILAESGRAIKVIEERVDRIKGDLKTPTIQFRAQLASSVTVNTGQDVVFSRVEVNEGQGYDSRTGKFTASVAGLYNFDVHFCVQQNYWVYLEIVHVGRSVQRLAHHNGGPHGYQGSSLQANIVMSMGDIVWVRATSTSYFYQTDSYCTNAFSGVLIRV
ncbi:uncharacterized protein LOC127834975 [Dreissena polymorpha]|uniref:C1q domain-containing protein n=1 Tax=Dreissena polymorpha TaxID=45954 RepID=A0A9D4JG89_DREPO|nr:uncharacterized protein LOC127834975 [Dreissena polymorpha]KAH3807603.1 hypothetical protein DPMN_135949 [Dreissena polymorpha]